MRPLVFSVILPALLIVIGITMVLFQYNEGIYLAGAGGMWLVISFLIGYKDDEEQPLGMGRGRKR